MTTKFIPAALASIILTTAAGAVFAADAPAVAKDQAKVEKECKELHKDGGAAYDACVKEKAAKAK